MYILSFFLTKKGRFKFVVEGEKIDRLAFTSVCVSLSLSCSRFFFRVSSFSIIIYIKKENEKKRTLFLQVKSMYME